MIGRQSHPSAKPHTLPKEVSLMRDPHFLCAVRLALLVCVSLLAGAAQAGGIDVARSSVYVFVDKTGAGHQHAVEGKLSKGELNLTRVQEAGSMTFDLRSLSADTSAARKALRLPGETDADTRRQVTANMLGSAVLDTARFPTAELKVRRVQALPADPKEPDQQHYQLEGELTLHGVTRAVQFKVTAAPVDGMTRIRGTADFKQTQFGIKPFSKLLGAIGVADAVRVYGEIWIKP
jgi:polyisoprenoid-binding protein YceI